MSRPWNNHLFQPLFLILAALFVGLSVHPGVLRAEADGDGAASFLPLLVKARPGDTATSIALRHLRDGSRGWEIAALNGKQAFARGEAVVVPRSTLHRGGLTPSGCQIVPVLAYREINSAAEDPGEIFVSMFARQIQWLKREGFTALTPARLLDFMDFATPPPPRSVLITVDTEALSFWEKGVPVLRDAGFTAILFVATDLVGTEGKMTWDQLDALGQAGFSIGCRGHSGRALSLGESKQPFAERFQRIVGELQTAKQTMQRHLDFAHLYLAYPEGRTSNLVAAVAAKLGYDAAFTLVPGENPFFVDRFGIHRVPITGPMTAKAFSGRLTTRMAVDLSP